VLDSDSRNINEQVSDYLLDQLPAYLLPDGTWRFGANAKRIASGAWARRKACSPQPADDKREKECCDLEAGKPAGLE
jgi:hypothetical protein